MLRNKFCHILPTSYAVIRFRKSRGFKISASISVGTAFNSITVVILSAFELYNEDKIKIY